MTCYCTSYRSLYPRLIPRIHRQKGDDPMSGTSTTLTIPALAATPTKAPRATKAKAPKAKTSKAAQPSTVHVLFVIDSSDSMAGRASDVRGGFNEYVKTLKE